MMSILKVFFCEIKVGIALFSLCMFNCALLGYHPTGTFIPVLISAVENTAGPILEIGCGDNSTPLLHALCSVNERYLLSISVDKEMFSKYSYLNRPWHQITILPSVAHVNKDVWWSVVLIDYISETERINAIKVLRATTDIFVVHDADSLHHEFNNLLDSFKYRYDYKQYVPSTTIVSDTIDISLFIEK